MDLDISRELADRAAVVAKEILGEPSWISASELHYGTRGALKVKIKGPKRGLWYDHAAGEGGNLIGLIKRQRGCNSRDAINVGRELLGIVSDNFSSQTNSPRSADRADDRDACRRKAIALGIWCEAVPVPGTDAERYFIAFRRLDVSDLDLSHAVRWHARSRAICSLMTQPLTGAPCGVHRTFLDDAARKIDRKMLGRQGVIRVSGDDEVTAGLAISEGVEDAIAIILSGWRPVWAATSAGAIARFPTIEGIRAITIFADADQAGANAAQVCARRWAETACEARIIWPGSFSLGR